MMKFRNDGYDNVAVELCISEGKDEMTLKLASVTGNGFHENVAKPQMYRVCSKPEWNKAENMKAVQPAFSNAQCLQ